jgi:hypothetical protein
MLICVESAPCVQVQRVAESSQRHCAAQRPQQRQVAIRHLDGPVLRRAGAVCGNCVAAGTRAVGGCLGVCGEFAAVLNSAVFAARRILALARVGVAFVWATLRGNGGTAGSCSSVGVGAHRNRTAVCRSVCRCRPIAVRAAMLRDTKGPR